MSVDVDLPGWAAVAAGGTDPATLAHVVALLTDAGGRATLRAHDAGQAALPGPGHDAAGGGSHDGGALPPVTSEQRAAAARALAVWAGLGVRVAVRGDAGWPTGLGRLAGPPTLLAWRGSPVLPTGPAVAIVGARRATGYGAGVAAWLAEAAAEAGATVVSGGARGIDAAAHGAAAHAGSIVVLGCGHDVDYPRQHARDGGLFDQVLAGGGAIVSELLPGTQPRPVAVRARNRIVAGLADVVVVVEGGPTSGALLTASAAAEAGIEVLAVPGDVRAPGSAAPHRLLAEGAGLCAEPADLLAALDLRAGTAVTDGSTASVLPQEVRRVLAASWPRPVRVGRLAAESALPVPRLLASLTRARVAGEVADGPEGVRLRRPPT